jgi:hypothetical protein
MGKGNFDGEELCSDSDEFAKLTGHYAEWLNNGNQKGRQSDALL